MTNDQLTPDTMQLNDVPPTGFTAPGKSLIGEIEKLHHQVAILCDAIAGLCDLQREAARKLDALLSNTEGRTAIGCLSGKELC